jgi:hypothetical protein
VYLKQFYLTLELLHGKLHLHLGHASLLQELPQLVLVVQRVLNYLLDARVGHVTLCIDLIHDGVNDAVLLEDRGALLEGTLHGVLLLDQALSRGLLPRLQQQHVYYVLHA